MVGSEVRVENVLLINGLEEAESEVEGQVSCAVVILGGELHRRPQARFTCSGWLVLVVDSVVVNGRLGSGVVQSAAGPRVMT